MDRREAVKYISLLMGGTVVGGTAFLTGCKSDTAKPQNWDASEIAYLDEIAETILPQTSTPGAKAAKVGEFMKVMVTDCYEASHQDAFRKGMTQLNETSKEKYNRVFMELDPKERHALLVEMDAAAKKYQEEIKKHNQEEDNKAKADLKYVKQTKAPHYFTMMKQLTLLGFFTSEVGTKEARRHTPVPGRFDACIPYKKGDKSFA